MGFKQRLTAFKNLDFAYAFLELLLIITGILVAFWIDTWWQERQNLQKEKAYLSALKTELEENRAIYKTHLEGLGKDITMTRNFISLINTYPQGNVPADSIMQYIWALKTIDIIIPRRAALDDLINSGGLQYIQSDLLRREIAGYEQIFEQDLEKQRATASEWNSSLAAFELDHVNYTEIIPPEGIEGISGEERITLPQLNFASNFNAFAGKEYVNRLIQRILLINSLRQIHQEVIGHIRRLVQLLDTELEGNASEISPIN